MKDKLFRFFTYFRQGHTKYLIFLLSFTNFIIIVYELLIVKYSMLTSVFSNIAWFAVVFMLIWVPVCIFIGWWDFYKGPMPVESAIHGKVSPWIQDIFKGLMLLTEGKNAEAAKIFSKWSGKPLVKTIIKEIPKNCSSCGCDLTVFKMNNNCLCVCHKKEK